MPEETAPKPREDPTPTDTEDAVRRAVERANEIQRLMVAAGIPASQITTLALTIASACAAQQQGMSLNDAFSLYLSGFEHAELGESERTMKMVEYMKNTFGEVIQRVLQIPPPKKETTH